MWDCFSAKLWGFFMYSEFMCSTACLLAEKLVSHYDPEWAVALPSASDPAGKGGPAQDSMGVQLQSSWRV